MAALFIFMVGFWLRLNELVIPFETLEHIHHQSAIIDWWSSKMQVLMGELDII